MPLEAGQVFAVLGGKFDKAGFEQFDAAVKSSAAQAEAAEARIRASMNRIGSAVPSSTLSQFDQNNKKAAQNLEKLGTVATKSAAVGILAVGAAATYAIAKTISFNQEILKLHTQAGASTQEMDRFRASILGLAGNVPQTPKELAQAMYHLASAGFRGSQAMEMLEASAKGAALGGASLEDTTQAVIGVLASHVKGVRNATDAMGQLNAIVGVGDMRMQAMAQSIATGILPTVAEAGLTLKDYGAALATVTDNVTPANVTATRLRMTLSMMVAPSKAAAKELASIGLSSTSLAKDLRQPNGLLVAVEDLRNHLRDSGKTAEEQDAILASAFGRGKSSGTIMTLIDEIGRLRTKYQELGKTDGVKRLQESWAEFQAKGTANIAEFKSSLEGFAISVGTVILPSITKLASEGAHALQGFVSSGGAKTVGHDIASGFETLGQVVSGLAPALEEIAKAFYDIGKAVGLGNATEIEVLLAAFAGFKSAQFVAPMLISIGEALFIVRDAAVAGELSSLPGMFMAAVGPVGLFATGVAAVASAFVLLTAHEESNAEASEKVTAAKKEEAAAISALQDAILGAANATFAARQADKRLADAKSHLADVAKKNGKDSEAYKVALEEEREASVRAMTSHQQVAKEEEAIQKQKEATRKKAQKEIEAATKRYFLEVSKAGDEVGEGKITPEKGGAIETAALEKYNAVVQTAARGTALAAISQIQLDRVLQGTNQIAAQSAVSVEKLTSVWNDLSKTQQVKLANTPEAQLAEIGDLVGRLKDIPRQQVVQIITKADGAVSQIEALRAVLHGVPASKVVQILTTARSAQVQVEALKAVVAGVPAAKVISILHNAPSAKAAMTALAGAIRAIPGSRSVGITTNAQDVMGQLKQLQATIFGLTGKEITILAKTQTTGAPGHASGRSAGATEGAIVGEGQGPEYIINRRTGRGGIVDRPTFMGLGPDDYVIPLEQRYRGRALGLFASLAADLEIPGYKKGRKAKGHQHHAPRPVPPQLDPLSLPIEQIEGDTNKAQQAYDKAHSKVSSLHSQLATAQRDLRYASPKGNARAKDAQKVREAESKLSKAQAEERKTHAQLLAEKKMLRQAKAYQAKITKETELANIAANDMRLADGRDDEAGYQSAKHRRLGALAALQKLIASAQKHVKAGSEYARKLTEQVQGSELETQSTEGEEFTTPQDKAAEREAQSGMTPQEEARLKEINKNIALAALTPSLDDDKSSAQSLVSFLEGVLGEAIAEPGPRGGDETIANIAGQLKTAKSNLESLSGNGTNENQDLQAQINQANERAEVAKREAQIANNALAVFNGSGDIGAGGANAAQAAAQPTIVHNNYMLHPSDPQVLQTLAEATVKGLQMQGVRRVVRQPAGQGMGVKRTGP